MPNYSPMRCQDEVLTIISSWDIGASGAHTKTANIPGTGFASVARTAAGKYTVTFARGVPIGPFLDLHIEHYPAVDAQPLDAHPKLSTFTAETAAAQATVKYETWDNDTTAQTELANGDKVVITARWLKTR